MYVLYLTVDDCLILIEFIIRLTGLNYTLSVLYSNSTVRTGPDNSPVKSRLFIFIEI